MKKRVLCFGDSNTWGYDAVSDGRFDDTVRWTGLLSDMLKKTHTIIEEGLSGRTCVFEDPLNEGLNGLPYLQPCMMSHSPLDYLIVMLGTNDCKERFCATPGNIADGMKRLLRKAIQTPAWRDSSRILLICPAPIPPQCEHSRVAQEMGACSHKSEELSREYLRCANELGIKFWDSREVVTMNQVDFMHFDAPSHRRFAEKVAGILEDWEN